ncbi:MULTISPECIES: HEAT repeat domain-containing protein [Nostocales]|uniref:HEAT repeat domain-containing protein n=3 Tax=Nostocales TaxID=1161 RepID=A0A8S9T626_9CYAN|nr:HEAT repeat domain-containing protein [Tolypothrix bouteillei]KAF3888021.1 HEAT repeat domain-containing protein [Tolypothrix bouteillei VB521301]
MSHSNIESLLEDCLSGDPSRQTPAILKLQDLKAYEAVPILVELLSSYESNIRGLAVQTLGWLGDEEIQTVGPALMKMLADSEELVRSEAVDALATLDYKQAIEAIKSLLRSDSNWIVRASAAEALGDLAEVGDSEVLAELELALNDPIEPVRAYSACAIGLLGTQEILPKLDVYFLSEESLDTKAEILAARYRLGVRNDLTELLKLLEGADDHLVCVILNILGDLVQRKVPVTLADDALQIRQILTGIAQSFPIHQGHAEKVIARLEAVELQLQLE